MQARDINGSTYMQEIWFNGLRYRFNAETMEVRKQRGMTSYWAKIEEGSKSRRVRAYAATK